jgi:hypothetical protein
MFSHFVWTGQTPHHEVRVHCNQDPIYIFPEMKLSGLVLNFHIHISVINLLLSGLVHLQNFAEANRRADHGDIEIAHRYMNVEIGE